jgi:hypothetical protein
VTTRSRAFAFALVGAALGIFFSQSALVIQRGAFAGGLAAVAVVNGARVCLSAL